MVTSSTIVSAISIFDKVMPRATTLNIDLSSLTHNTSILRKLAAPQKIMAVIKANAYGHGLVKIGQHLQHQVDGFAVAITEEAILLRDAGISSPILVLEGPHSEEDMVQMKERQLWPVFHNLKQVSWCPIEAPGLSEAWLKIDSGMHRLGFSIGEIATIKSSLETHGVKNLTLMSHLAAAEYFDNELNKSQLRLWRSALQQWDSPTSIQNSAAIRTFSSAGSDWARVGYALFGGNIQGIPKDLSLKPTMHLKSEVIATRKIPQGNSVGYGGRWVAPRDSTIATLPIGYGDGYPRSAIDGTPVLVNGRTGKLAGTVSMDMITVDVTDCGDIKPGMPATLWGGEIDIDEVALNCGTIGYELMTRITERVPRHYHE